MHLPILRNINLMLLIANQIPTILLQTIEKETLLPRVHSRIPEKLEEGDEAVPIEAVEEFPSTRGPFSNNNLYGGARHPRT